MTDGTRTRNDWDHDPALFRLSYGHRTPRGTRTPNHLVRSQAFYPVELEALVGNGVPHSPQCRPETWEFPSKASACLVESEPLGVSRFPE